MADVHFSSRSPAAERVIQRALKILETEIKQCGPTLNSANRVREYLSLEIGRLEHEEFAVLWLDSQNRMIEFERMFRGTLTNTSVYPREVVKSALKFNACAAIFAHNHPSGVAEPSEADKLMTLKLKEALSTIDVKMLDHFVVAGNQITSIEETRAFEDLRARQEVYKAIRARRSAAAKKAWRRRRAAGNLKTHHSDA